MCNCIKWILPIKFLANINTTTIYICSLYEFMALISRILCSVQLLSHVRLCDHMDCGMPGFPVFHCLPEFAQFMSIESVVPFNHLILCCPFLLLPSIFPSLRVFSSESGKSLNQSALKMTFLILYVKE